MKTELVKITPEVASVLLQKNSGNRNLRRKIVEKYATEMLAGRWMGSTGESIKISESGVLLDGQHRLMAVIKSNIPAEFLVCHEVPEEAFKVLDSGIVRNHSDVFGISGVPYHANLPSIISTYRFIKTGKDISSSYRYSSSDLLTFYNQNSIFWDEVARKTANWYNQFGKVLQPSMIGAVYAEFSDKDPEDAIRFMDQLCGGMDIKNKAVALLRKKLIDDRVSTRKMPTKIKLGYIIKSWNFFRKMESPKVLKINLELEEFPSSI